MTTRTDWADDVGDEVDAAYLNGLGTAVNTAATNITALQLLSVLTGVASATTATAETSTSTSYAALTTATSTAATIGASGKALVAIYAQASPGANMGGYASFAVSGASTVAATDARSVYTQEAAGTGKPSRLGLWHVTGLSAGSNTFAMQFKALTGGHSVTWSNRHIIVIPLP